MTKVIFQLGSKSKEVDLKDINSEEDVKNLMIEVAMGESKDVTQILENTSKMEQVIKARREKILEEAKNAMMNFCDTYNKYAPELKEWYSKEILTEEEIIKRNLVETNLAFLWCKVKRIPEASKHLFDHHPNMRAYCKLLDKIHKEIKKNLV